ncbi:hypothetical protein D6764_01620 [Candidatus Woesearchaeota archaeon]|nr:MAG: hypothetical protein D6764_01620 [Candidatus Woesearchaeota archaeon]
MDVCEKLKGLGENYSALIVTPISLLKDELLHVVRKATGTGLPILLLTLNKPQEALDEQFRAEGIDTSKILYVDCIAKSLGTVTRKKNVIHIEHASDLTSINIAVSEFIEKIKTEKFIIIDALATLLIYNSEDMVVKFVRSVVQSARGSRLICFTPSAKGLSFIEKISVYFDEVVDLSAEENASQSR